MLSPRRPTTKDVVVIGWPPSGRYAAGTRSAGRHGAGGSDGTRRVPSPTELRGRDEVRLLRAGGHGNRGDRTGEGREDGHPAPPLATGTGEGGSDGGRESG